MARPVMLSSAGLVTSVGLSAPASCAAIRAALTNHTETGFRNEDGESILAAQVDLDVALRGRERLIAMLSLAVTECLEASDPVDAAVVPLLLCVAEAHRPGRVGGLEDRLLDELQADLQLQFHQESAIVPHGRVAAFLALGHAQDLLSRPDIPCVVIAAVDSLLTAGTLEGLSEQGRLLTAENPDGFIPGEAAGALLVTRHPSRHDGIVFRGLGTGQEPSAIAADKPLRADGLTVAITEALRAANCEMEDLHFRITDNSGEQYYFKEAALALSRILRKRREEFDLWHPADCVGETGAAIGVIALAVALAAIRKRYAPGSGILLHAGNDAGRRAAIILGHEGTA